MNPELLEKVLSCKTLPTLPEVAVRVLDLMQDQNVTVQAIASTIQNDQGLSAKVLRTVNSSFYGLRNRCSTIDQSLVLLGMSAVKTLALGFSLVSAISETEDDQFDFPDYWRRAIYTAIAAKCISSAAEIGADEQCFLGGLLQDVGMVAFYQALGKEYLDVVAQSKDDHRSLIKLEHQQFEITHPDIGALLAARWKLPDELTLPIKYHERPTASPVEHASIVRAVALGNYASDVLTSKEPAGPLKRFYARSSEWFDIHAARADDILKMITSAAGEVSKLFQLRTGQTVDAEVVLTNAREQLSRMALPLDDVSPGLHAEAGADRDVVGTLPDRKKIESNMIAAFEQVRAGVGPLSLAMFSFDTPNGPLVPASAEDKARFSARVAVLQRVFPGPAFMVGRYDESTIAVLMPRIDRVNAARATEIARRTLAGVASNATADEASGGRSRCTASIGLITVSGENLGQFDSHADVTAKAEQAIAAARAAGGNTIRIHSSKAA